MAAARARNRGGPVQPGSIAPKPKRNVQQSGHARLRGNLAEFERWMRLAGYGHLLDAQGRGTVQVTGRSHLDDAYGYASMMDRARERRDHSFGQSAEHKATQDALKLFLLRVGGSMTVEDEEIAKFRPDEVELRIERVHDHSDMRIRHRVEVRGNFEKKNPRKKLFDLADAMEADAASLDSDFDAEMAGALIDHAHSLRQIAREIFG